MKRGFYTLLFVGVATASFASTRVVDGVGGGGNFDSLSAALADLAVSADNGDGTADVINITASYTEAAHVLIDHSVLQDEVIVNGNGNTIVFEASAVLDGTAISIRFDSDSETTFNGLTLLPEYNTDGGVVSFAGAAMRIWDQGAPATGATVNVSDLLITSSTVGNAAVDADAAAPEDHTRWAFGAAPMFAGGIRTDSTTGGSDNVINISDSKVSHTGSRGVYVAHKAGTTAITTNVEAKYNNGNGFRTFDTTGDWIANNCVANFNTIAAGQSGVTTAGNAAGAAIVINGGEYSGNAFYGLEFNSHNVVTLTGTPENPLKVLNNPNRGVRFNNALTVCTGIAHAIIANNESFGIDVNELDTAGSWGDGITGLRMSGNGHILAGVTPAQISYGDTHDAAVDGGAGFIMVTDSTFHDPGGDENASFPVVNFEHRFGLDQTWNFEGCIFSGAAADDDWAFRFRAPTAGDGVARNIVVNLTESAVVTAGPYALPAADSFPPTFTPDGQTTAVTSGDGTVNESLVIGDDPDYLSLDPTNVEDYLAVQNPAYENAGIAGAPLAGGGRYAGPGTSVSGWELFH